MDYAHAQRVLADLALRRSLRPSIELSRPLPSILRELFQFQSFGFDYLSPMKEIIGPPAIATPLVGVGIGGTDSEPTIAFLRDRHGPDFDYTRLADSLGFEGLNVEVIFGGRARASARPTEGGESLGHPCGDSGTFGCLIEDGQGDQFLLSCNHVIANLNLGSKGSDEVWQPGKTGGGSARSRIGLLHNFAHITMGGSTGNRIDAALCTPDRSTDVSTIVKKIGLLAGSATAALGASVRKSGATTGLTHGKVRLKNLSVIVDYASGSQALFDGQLAVIGTTSGNFSDLGDSGSVVVDDGNAVVGLIISSLAGVDLTIANPIDAVLSHFNVAIAC